MIRNFGGVTGATNQPTGLDIGLGGGSNIKSIQRGKGNLANGSSTVNIPISSVDLTKSIVIVSSFNAGSASTTSANISISGKLTTNTNVLLSRQGSTDIVTYVWQVIEFNNVKSLQTGSKSLTTSSSTVTISQVAAEKSVLYYSSTNNNSTAGAVATMIGSLTNVTTITFEQLSTITFTIEWQLIEFN